jgi:hypothetical protein
MAILDIPKIPQLEDPEATAFDLTAQRMVTNLPPFSELLLIVGGNDAAPR